MLEINHFEDIEISMLPKQGESILDFGVGGGKVTRFLLAHGYNVVGCDIDNIFFENIISQLNEAERKSFSFINVMYSCHELLERHSGDFAAIICREVLEHVKDYESLLQVFKKVLVHDGTLIVSVPTSFSEHLFLMFDKNWLQKSQHLKIFEITNLVEVLDQHYFTVQKIEYRGFRWFLVWLFLSPFKVNHVMGTPINNNILIKTVLRLAAFLTSCRYIAQLGNLLFPKNVVFYCRPRKPRILLVYDYDYWVLRRWAIQIERLFGDRYEFTAVSMDFIHEEKHARNIVSGADLVHIMLPHAFPFVEMHAKRLVTHVHHWVEDNSYDKVISASDHIVTGSEEWRERLTVRGINGDQITVITAGVEDQFFVSDKCSTLNNVTTIGFFAKFDSNERDRKGTRHLLGLANLISLRGETAQYRFIIVGPGWDKLVMQLRDSGHVIEYFDFVDQKLLPGIYRQLDIYLILSDIEGGPVTILEAMASRCLVVSTKVGLARDFIRDGINGLYIDNSDYSMILSRITEVKYDQEHYLSMTNNAYEDVSSTKTFEKAFKSLPDVYEKVLAIDKGITS